MFQTRRDAAQLPDRMRGGEFAAHALGPHRHQRAFGQPEAAQVIGCWMIAKPGGKPQNGREPAAATNRKASVRTIKGRAGATMPRALVVGRAAQMGSVQVAHRATTVD